MNLVPRKTRIYLSHSIRGDGSLSMEQNCINASKVANKIRRLFPEIEIFVPGEKDICLQLLEKEGKVSVEDIIWVDKEILKKCHGWFWWKTSESNGCEEEMHEAMKFLPEFLPESVITTDLLKANYSEVRRLLNPIVEKAKERFHESKLQRRRGTKTMWKL